MTKAEFVNTIRKDLGALQAIVDQLEACHYECEAGPLENNVEFVKLKDIAKRWYFARGDVKNEASKGTA